MDLAQIGSVDRISLGSIESIVREIAAVLDAIRAARPFDLPGTQARLEEAATLADGVRHRIASASARLGQPVPDWSSPGELAVVVGRLEEGLLELDRHDQRRRLSTIAELLRGGRFVNPKSRKPLNTFEPIRLAAVDELDRVAVENLTEIPGPLGANEWFDWVWADPTIAESQLEGVRTWAPNLVQLVLETDKSQWEPGRLTPTVTVPAVVPSAPPELAAPQSEPEPNTRNGAQPTSLRGEGAAVRTPEPRPPAASPPPSPRGGIQNRQTKSLLLQPLFRAAQTRGRESREGTGLQPSTRIGESAKSPVLEAPSLVEAIPPVSVEPPIPELRVQPTEPSEPTPMVAESQVPTTPEPAPITVVPPAQPPLETSPALQTPTDRTLRAPTAVPAIKRAEPAERSQKPTPKTPSHEPAEPVLRLADDAEIGSCCGAGDYLRSALLSAGRLFAGEAERDPRLDALLVAHHVTRDSRTVPWPNWCSDATAVEEICRTAPESARLVFLAARCHASADGASDPLPKPVVDRFVAVFNELPEVRSWLTAYLEAVAVPGLWEQICRHTGPGPLVEYQERRRAFATLYENGLQYRNINVAYIHRQDHFLSRKPAAKALFDHLKPEVPAQPRPDLRLQIETFLDLKPEAVTDEWRASTERAVGGGVRLRGNQRTDLIDRAAEFLEIANRAWKAAAVVLQRPQQSGDLDRKRKLLTESGRTALDRFTGRPWLPLLRRLIGGLLA
ncbi:MAG: hypothetical protein C0467_21615 [Planctomycetaceae bacterium]|nr:hypothetical protein [Planctomycetaceae bacterium]